MRRRHTQRLRSLAALVAAAGAAGLASAGPAQSAVIVTASGTKVRIAHDPGGTDSIYIYQSGANLVVSTTPNGPAVSGGSVPLASVKKILIDLRRSGDYPVLRADLVNGPEIQWSLMGRKGNDPVFFEGVVCRRLQMRFGGGYDTFHLGAVAISESSTFDGGANSDRFLQASTPAIEGAEVEILGFEVMDFD